MTAAPVFMIRTVATDGTVEQFLPDFSTIDMSPVYCDAGTVKFTYPLRGVNYSLLKEDLELAIMVNGIEVPDLRCKIETIEGNDADDAEQGALWTYTCRTMAGQLDYSVVYPANYVYWIRKIIGMGKAPTWTNKTAGVILGDLFSESQARGGMAGFTWDFTDTHDSEGNTWSDQITLSPDVGKPYLSVMKDLAATGTIEFNVVGRKVRVWDRNKMGIDRSVGSAPLIFRKGRDVSDAPRKIDTRGLVTAALVSNQSNNAYAEVLDTPSAAVYGRREGFTTFGDLPFTNIASTSFLELGGNFYLSQNDKPAVEVTHGLHFETEDQPRPVTNFNIGDWAYTDVGRGLERFRILQWVMSAAADGSVTGSLTMGYLFNTQLSQINSSVNSLINGGLNAGSAPKNDHVAPDQVGAPTPISATYFVNNIPRDNLTVSWPAVTDNADGTDITDLDYYEVAWKYTSDSSWRPAQRVEQDSTVCQFTNLDPGAGVNIRVRASDVWNNHGLWSPTVNHTLAGDTIAPNKPAAPVVTSNVGTLRIVWSGLDSGGAAMPVDLKGVEVHVSTSDFVPSSATKKDVLPPGVLSTTITQGLTYGQEYWVKLIAFDTTGNRSAASDTTSTSHVVLKQVVATEIGTGQVGLSQVAFSDVGNLIDDGTFALADTRAARTTLMGIQHMAFDNSTASNGAWSIRSDPWAGTSSESILLQGSLPVKPGERVFGAADYRVTADVPAGSYFTLAVKWVDKSGNYLDNTGAISNVFYTLADNGFTTADNAWHARVTGGSKVAPANAASMEIWLITTSRTLGTIWVDAVEVRKQIDTLLIQNAAITSALIANLAVNDAHIANVSAGKLTVGTLSADIILGARIKTADTGARVEVNSGGFGAWNGAGVQTVAIAGADGSVTLLGQLKSGVSGRRIEINPTATYLPEMRFYPDSGSNFGFLNAYSPAGSSMAYIGLNSGQFTWNGQTCETRLYMTDVATTLEAVRVDTQARLGPYFELTPASVNMGWRDPSGIDKGYMTAGSGGLEIGYNDTSTGNDAYMDFQSDGRIVTHGRYYNYLSADSNQALFTGSVGWTGASGVILGFGVTMLSQPIPVACGYYTGASAPSFYVDDRSTTGFSFHSTVSVNATCQFWVFRV